MIVKIKPHNDRRPLYPSANKREAVEKRSDMTPDQIQVFALRQALDTAAAAMEGGSIQFHLNRIQEALSLDPPRTAVALESVEEIQAGLASAAQAARNAR